MWSNVWFRSLFELILVIVGTLIFVWGMQQFEGGRGVIQQVRQHMGF